MQHVSELIIAVLDEISALEANFPITGDSDVMTLVKVLYIEYYWVIYNLSCDVVIASIAKVSKEMFKIAVPCQSNGCYDF